MKRYIRASYEISPELEEFNQKLTADPYFDIKVAQPASEVLNRGGYIYIFKVKGGTNVYRLFADDRDMQLIFQYIAEAFYIDGKEYYDDAVDVADTSDAPISEWYDLVKHWVKLAEVQDPDFTHYEYEE